MFYKDIEITNKDMQSLKTLYNFITFGCICQPKVYEHYVEYDHYDDCDHYDHCEHYENHTLSVDNPFERLTMEYLDTNITVKLNLDRSAINETDNKSLMNEWFTLDNDRWYPTTRLYEAIVELYQTSRKPKTMNTVVDKTKSIVFKHINGSYQPIKVQQ